MVFGIGVDIVSIARMDQKLSKHGERFAERILTLNELDDFHKCSNPAAYLAKRYAAKEAVAKAFGTGFRHGLSLTHIEVTNDDLGKPLVNLSGIAIDLMQQLGASTVHISLSDEKEFAIAYVMLS